MRFDQAASQQDVMTRRKQDVIFCGFHPDRLISVLVPNMSLKTDFATPSKYQPLSEKFATICTTILPEYGFVSSDTSHANIGGFSGLHLQILEKLKVF